MTEQQKKRREWVARKVKAANKYLSDRLAANEEALRLYADKAKRIRASNNPQTFWFAEFLEETCIPDLETEHITLQERLTQLNEKNMELCWMMARDEELLSADSG